MKLHELKSLSEARKQSVELKDIDIWDQAGLEPVNIEVEFDYEAPSGQDHPYGEGSAREELGAVVDIATVRLTKEANIYDEDEKVVRVLKKGTDLMKEPFYKAKDTKWLSDQVVEKMED
jgi:hypothetical protein